MSRPLHEWWKHEAYGEVFDLRTREGKRRLQRAEYLSRRRRGLSAIDALEATYKKPCDLPTRPEMRLLAKRAGDPWQVPSPLTRREINARAEVLWCIRKGWLMAAKQPEWTNNRWRLQSYASPYDYAAWVDLTPPRD